MLVSNMMFTKKNIIERISVNCPFLSTGSIAGLLAICMGIKMSIILEKVTKRYDRTVVSQVSFKLDRNQNLAILGRNGSGKSTIIKMILGLKQPSEGNVIIDKELKIGYLPEERGLYMDTTVYENLDLFARLAHVTNRKKVKDYWLERMDIGKYRDFKLKFLSKGNAQKLQLAVALINEPELIILDEPFSGLDPINMSLFIDVIKEKTKGKYMIMSSHQMNRVEELCDDVILMNQGEVIVQGNINEIKEKYSRNEIRIPYSPELENIFKEYDLKSDGKEITISVSPKDSKALSILKKVIAEKNMEYFHYNKTNLNDLFVNLLS